MSGEKTVTNISIRSAYDSLGEIMGTRARNMIIKKAGLSRILDAPPDYTWDKEFSYDEQLALYTETIRLIGKVGAQGILRQIGYRNAQTTILTFHVLDSIKELPPDEKFEKSLGFLTAAIGRGKARSSPGERTCLDVADCTACQGAKSTKPYCSQYSGVIQFLSDWSYGKGAFRVIETKCKAMGDSTCLFELIDVT
jgi:predicted hydrocarbon binding protein